MKTGAGCDGSKGMLVIGGVWHLENLTLDGVGLPHLGGGVA